MTTTMTSRNQPETIIAQALLPDVIERYPGTRAVFDRYGLRGGVWGIRWILPTAAPRRYQQPDWFIHTRVCFSLSVCHILHGDKLLDLSAYRGR